MDQINISYFKIFLTSYAEINENTTCCVIKTTLNSLIDEWFKISRCYYGKRHDNMIFEISFYGAKLLIEFCSLNMRINDRFGKLSHKKHVGDA